MWGGQGGEGEGNPGLNDWGARYQPKLQMRRKRPGALVASQAARTKRAENDCGASSFNEVETAAESTAYLHLLFA